ncbi:hypothetical protein LIER_37490 [Lithospermum erythrorhizon]|uniref:Reverse transcriptase zinc-binding domain-containing protein n=1 Tax=Lithospermum erythrorhizon TaxID=34254 RepID=A0AAV3PNY0_LITER
MGGVYNKIWNSLGRLKIPYRVKNFMWKLLHNVLPTKVNPRCKGIVIDDQWPFCNNALETLEHLFLHCPVSTRGETNSAATNWIALAGGRYKMNCDADCFKDQNLEAVGVIVRDENGDFMGAPFRIIPSVLKAVVVVAFAIREGLDLDIKQG